MMVAAQLSLMHIAAFGISCGFFLTCLKCLGGFCYWKQILLPVVFKLFHAKLP